MNAPTSITLNAPEDVLTVVPHIIGHRPENCVVVIALERDGVENIGPMIVASEDNIDHGFGEQLAEFAERFEVTTLAMAWYTDGLEAKTGSDVARILDKAALDTQAWLDERYQSDVKGFVSYFATDYDLYVHGSQVANGLAEEMGTYRDLEQSVANVELILAGSAPAAHATPVLIDRLGYGEDSELVTEYRSLLADGEINAAEQWNALLVSVMADADALSADGLLTMVGGQRAMARLHAGLTDITIRDRVLVFAVNPEVESVSGMDIDDIETALHAATAVNPDGERLARITDVMRMIGAYSPEDAPAALALVGYLYWWAGRSGAAAEYVQAALDADPSYSLARLVEQALDIQLPPPWFK